MEGKHVELSVEGDEVVIHMDRRTGNYLALCLVHVSPDSPLGLLRTLLDAKLAGAPYALKQLKKFDG
jgi:hypothetical protein